MGDEPPKDTPERPIPDHLEVVETYLFGAASAEAIGSYLAEEGVEDVELEYGSNPPPLTPRRA